MELHWTRGGIPGQNTGTTAIAGVVRRVSIAAMSTVANSEQEATEYGQQAACCLDLLNYLDRLKMHSGFLPAK